MTVVAFDGRVMAADKRSSFGGLHATTTKVHSVGGMVIAGCGPTALIAEMRQWLVDGADPATFPAAQRDDTKCTSILVKRPGTPLWQYENTPHPIVIENAQWAIGSGRDFAVMAMHLGKSAVEAVELTSLFCSDCGNGVDAIEVTRP